MRVCTVCLGDLSECLLTHREPDRFELNAGITSEGYRRDCIQCCNCGSATNIQIKENAIKLAAVAANYYEVDFVNSSILEKYQRVLAMSPGDSDNAGRVERICEAIQKFQSPLIAPTVAMNRRVLDIGSGTGVFLKVFLDDPDNDGWSGFGVEPDPHAAAHLREIGQFDVHEGLFEGQPEFGKFDLVTLNKVVEHMPDPIQLMQLAAGSLREDTGLLYVEVPDVLTINARPVEDNILGALHHHLYTPLGLASLVVRAGLEAVHIGRTIEPSGKITVFAFAMIRSAIKQLCKFDQSTQQNDR